MPAMENLTEQNEYLLGLMAMTVFADKQVLSEEIKAFVRVGIYLKEAWLLPEEMDEPSLIKWYEANKIRLRSKLAGDRFAPWLNSCLSSLDPIPNKTPILVAMTDIAKADEDLHVSEIALVRLAARHWKMAA